jgi:two-component system nitrogen regulation response regulator NtrX
MRTSILIIDDEPGIRRTLASILEDEDYLVYSAEDAVLGLEILGEKSVNLVFLDVLLPKLGGMEALERIRGEWPQAEVVMISGHANVDMAVRAVKLGAFDFLEKPLSLDKVLTVCRNALTVQNLREENRDLKKKLPRDEIIGTSGRMEEVRGLIRQAAASDARILITGENGTGKELAARAIHRASSRSDRAFVEVNCAAIPDTLIESELFGHEMGAFTDAVSGRKGRFELADRGTLFLDEIGDMSHTAQAKVLRAIQEQQIERVGGEKTIDVDVRIVAATNKDLEAECAAGRFRQDLFFRLNVIPIRIPPLRERPEDIPLLLFHFLGELFRGAGDSGEAPQAEPKAAPPAGRENCPFEFDEAALALIRSHPWPGNVRELRNLAERIAVMHRGGKIAAEEIGALMQQHPAGPPVPAAAGGTGDPALTVPGEIMYMNYNDAKESFEKCYLEFQLAKNNGVISRTAEALGIYPSNLHAKLRKYGLRTER